MCNNNNNNNNYKCVRILLLRQSFPLAENAANSEMRIVQLIALT